MISAGGPAYAELQVTTNFSFLHCASHPQELVAQSASLGHRAIGIADRNTLAGMVRAHVAAKQCGLRLVVGVRLDFTDAPSMLCFPTDRRAYGRLCCLLTLGRRRAPKGECHIHLSDLFDHELGQIVVVLPSRDPEEGLADHLRRLKVVFADRLYLAGQALMQGDDRERLETLVDIAAKGGVPLVATNDVHYHHPDRRPLCDVLACIREKVTIAEAGSRLWPNAERHLKPPEEMAILFRDHPDALSRTLEIVDRCHFSLDEIKYDYPAESDRGDPQEELERLTVEGAAVRYPQGMPRQVGEAIAREFDLIRKKNYAPYFLTVYDIVRMAREKGILCQGRGSAANSAVCYCLGITSVDPAQSELLFERFVSEERREPPDIDVDFEHERREEVIQYIYEKLGRDRAGLAATVIHYRWRRAIRDVGKVMGLSLDTVAALAKVGWGGETPEQIRDTIGRAGLDPDDAHLLQTIGLTLDLVGFPRHLSQHVGGFVMTRGALCESVPIENAAMAERTVVEWDKDDLEELGMLKVDILALGMLTCVRKCFDLLNSRGYGFRDLADVPRDDPAVYGMMQRADTIGVFQIESRAQMSMLPRLKPASFYELVIEIAIVRPGPIQGDMVHPYLRRKEGLEPITYPKPELEAVLHRTKGVPLFQEQAMKIAMVAARFTASEADGLRRSMATFRNNGTVRNYKDKFIQGMIGNGYERDFAEKCFKQIEGFGEYGFPESHAASFAIIAYVSAWLKHHHPAVFAAGLLNSQPMGFYAPAQIVRDAREHGVEVRPIDVNKSEWDCTLETTRTGKLSLRLGFREAKGLSEEAMRELVKRRGDGYRTLRDLHERAGLTREMMETLAAADAFGSIGLDRRHAHWEIRALAPFSLPLFAAAERAIRPGSNMPSPDAFEEQAIRLPRMPMGEAVVEDYSALQMSLRAHPAELLRSILASEGYETSGRLKTMSDGAPVGVAGLVLVRQRPGTASGVIFATLEDESGIANVVIWPRVFERYRRALLGSRLLGVRGKLQRQDLVIHIVAERLEDLSRHLVRLGEIDSELHPPIAHADEVLHPGTDARAVMPKGRNFH